MMSKKYQGMFIRLKPKQHEKLQAIQHNDGITIAEQIRIAVAKYLRGM